MGILNSEEIDRVLQWSQLISKYNEEIDRESAYPFLSQTKTAIMGINVFSLFVTVIIALFITSTISKEGKTYISINLSTSFALSDKKTLLIGFDLRHPKIAEYLNLNEKKGITNFLIDKSSRIEDFIIKKNDDNLLFDVLLSGPIPPNPSELLMHKKIEAIFNYARENYDYIVVDTAPVGLVADTLLLNEFADCSVYVVKANYLDKRMLHIANDLNKSKRLTNIAFLLNGRDTSAISYGYGFIGI
jgi:capsular exopolysaccharide synthesis family protein